MGESCAGTGCGMRARWRITVGGAFFTSGCDHHAFDLGGRLPGARVEAIERSGPERKVVLVVDDDESVRELVVAALESRGVMSLVALNASEALQIGEAWRFDVALVDVGLPDRDGEELARELVAMQAWSKVVVMSGEPGPGRLEKPIRLRALWDAVGLP